jgi:tRNA U54 and U55 pseudouridine synthase Pus10
MALKIKEGSQLQKEFHRNRKQLDNEVDPELVQTYEEYQTEYSNKLGKYLIKQTHSVYNSNNSNLIVFIDQEKIKKLVQCGYPLDYVKKSLEENEPNYCTAGYYLLGMD